MAHARYSLYFTMGQEMPKKLPLLVGGSGPPPNTWFLGPSRVYILNGISIASAIFVRLKIVTNRQTDTDHGTSVTGHILFVA